MDEGEPKERVRCRAQGGDDGLEEDSGSFAVTDVSRLTSGENRRSD